MKEIQTKIWSILINQNDQEKKLKDLYVLFLKEQEKNLNIQTDEKEDFIKEIQKEIKKIEKL